MRSKRKNWRNLGLNCYCQSMPYCRYVEFMLIPYSILFHILGLISSLNPIPKEFFIHADNYLNRHHFIYLHSNLKELHLYVTDNFQTIHERCMNFNYIIIDLFRSRLSVFVEKGSKNILRHCVTISRDTKTFNSGPHNCIELIMYYHGTEFCSSLVRTDLIKNVILIEGNIRKYPFLKMNK